MIDILMFAAAGCALIAIGFLAGGFFASGRIEDLEIQIIELEQDLIEARHVSAFK